MDREPIIQTVTLALILLASLAPGTPPAQAQDPGAVRWDRPVALSRDVPRSGRPTVVADAFGRVHVFWETVYSPFAENPNVWGSVIYYTQFDGEQWTTPVDVFLSPGAYSSAAQVSAAVDKGGNLYAAFTVPNGPLYFTRAPVGSAGNAKNWSARTEIDNTTQVPYLLAAPDGALHLFYWNTGTARGVYYTRSTDGGRRWTNPALIGLAETRSGQIPRVTDNIMAIVDARGVLHAIWHDINAEKNVSYARSEDSGLTWTRPLVLDTSEPGERVGTQWPSIAVDNRGTLIALWSAGHENVSCGRFQRISADGGKTWTPRRRVLAPMEGCLHPSEMQVDGNGTLYMAAVARDDKGFHRLWLSNWGANEWAPPQSFTAIASKDDWQTNGPDRLKFSIGLGNQVYVVWGSGNQLAWYLHGETSASRMAPLPLPTAAPEATRPVPTLSPTTVARLAPTTAPREPNSSSPAQAPDYSPAPLVVGLLPVVLLLLAITAARLRKP